MLRDGISLLNDVLFLWPASRPAAARRPGPLVLTPSARQIPARPRHWVRSLDWAPPPHHPPSSGRGVRAAWCGAGASPTSGKVSAPPSPLEPPSAPGVTHIPKRYPDGARDLPSTLPPHGLRYRHEAYLAPPTQR